MGTFRIFAALSAAAAVLGQPRPEHPRPKLILAITVDQFRADYLTRFRSHYRFGLDRMLREGAVYANCHYEHFPTVTAVGHATFLTGATPSIHGIVGNEWFSRELGRQVTSVSDANYTTLGAPGREAASPRKLLVSTIGDEMKMSGKGGKVIGISFKDRSAILPVGRMADAAYWFDNRSGNFVSSTFYMTALPRWVEEFNKSRSADRFVGAEWRPLDESNPGAKPFKKLAGQADAAYWGSLQSTPYSNELIAQMAERAIENERLGAREGIDLLAVSFSGNDYVGHRLGPDAAEVRDISIRTDRLLGRLLEVAEAHAGKGNVLAVLTADHGVAPLPEVMAERRMPGGRLPEQVVSETLQARLGEIYGEGTWVAGRSGPSPYLNHHLIAERKLDLAEVRRRAAEIVRGIAHIARVWTLDELAAGPAPRDQVDARVLRGLYPPRAADIYFVTEPYWMFEDEGTSHGSPYAYDSHVPLLVWGTGVRAGRHPRRVEVNDIAPTLATMLDIETPSGSVGQPLMEVLAAH
jgi:predicted AlkP superfamily pyrophosphatase or phosphodiesterase